MSEKEEVKNLEDSITAIVDGLVKMDKGITYILKEMVGKSFKEAFEEETGVEIDEDMKEAIKEKVSEKMLVRITEEIEQFEPEDVNKAYK